MLCAIKPFQSLACFRKPVVHHHFPVGFMTRLYILYHERFHISIQWVSRSEHSHTQQQCCSAHTPGRDFIILQATKGKSTFMPFNSIDDTNMKKEAFRPSCIDPNFNYITCTIMSINNINFNICHYIVSKYVPALTELTVSGHRLALAIHFFMNACLVNIVVNSPLQCHQT